ncbi:hypothetical protein [Nubsella zeaxanthinifaciens]|uniref:hypothetical protein n=1 Tax=Nubsella zeaxanthinifaciens TaxID=392412 RepID=UPI000DE54670|nr:hypothetical protein [Nubsella zeaxanthinifaciens]
MTKRIKTKSIFTAISFGVLKPLHSTCILNPKLADTGHVVKASMGLGRAAQYERLAGLNLNSSNATAFLKLIT